MIKKRNPKPPSDMIEGRELDALPEKEVKDKLDIFRKHLENKDENYPETLGLHLCFDVRKEAPEIKASYWVGLVWLDEKKGIAVRVKSKWQRRSENKPIELILLEECLRFPQVAERLWGRRGIEADRGEQLFHYWPDQTPIKVTKEEDYAGYLFLIAQFLYELKKLCERHLRRQFPRVEENLRGRVKGKILIWENLRANTCRGRFDRVFCSFQTHSLDTRENQILKAALEVSEAYLATRGFRMPALWSLARFCKSALTEVSSRRIRPEDFQGLRLSGLMRPYQKPIELARIILLHISSEPNPSKWESEEVEVFPYAINMHQLFERYCEVLLRSKGICGRKPDHLWPGDQNLGDDFKVRPDFLIVEGKEGIVADAKYKFNWSLECREDVYQVVAYTQHKGVREKLKSLGAEKLGECIWIFYPCFPDGDYKEKDCPKMQKFESFVPKIETYSISPPET